MKYVETGTDHYHSVGYGYDTDNNLTSLVETINGTDYTTSYVYDDDNRLTSMTANGTTVEYTYDDYGRVTTQVTKRGDATILMETFTYVNPSETTTSSQIATYTTAATNYTVTYAYTYDDNGNILSVTESKNIAGTEQEYVTTYAYDSANQLIRENNQRRNRSYTWAYDNAGNVLSEKTYVYTTGDLSTTTPAVNNSYTYGDEAWGDLLLFYNGRKIIYDTIGNPTNDSTRTYIWEHGRELSSLTQNNVTWYYTYDSNGMRTRRASGAKNYNYIYSGSKLMQMSVGGNTLNFTYDASGAPLTISYNGITFYYVTNVQGDVVGILSPSGVEVVRYGYDAWGNIMSVSGTMASSLGATNPLRYRGYVYDEETELYYLRSRYYDPEIGRFINADGLVSTGQGLLGNNMFAYCLNSPVLYIDTDGRTADAATAAAAWAGSMWWICFVDGTLPIGEAVYFIGIVALAICTAIVVDETTTPQISLEEENSSVYAYREHTKGARQSTKGKHQKGQTRKNRDNRGEKGDARRHYMGNKNKLKMLFLIAGDLFHEDEYTQVVISGGAISAGFSEGGGAPGLFVAHMLY